jgi:hypothetical protein
VSRKALAAVEPLEKQNCGRFAVGVAVSACTRILRRPGDPPPPPPGTPALHCHQPARTRRAGRRETGSASPQGPIPQIKRNKSGTKILQSEARPQLLWEPQLGQLDQTGWSVPPCVRAGCRCQWHDDYVWVSSGMRGNLKQSKLNLKQTLPPGHGLPVEVAAAPPDKKL